MGDFLRKNAPTPWTERYLVAGVLTAIATNSQNILKAARESFCPVQDVRTGPLMHWRFWVDPHGNSQPPWPKPFFRGMDHLIFAGLHEDSSMLIDLQTRRVIGRVSPALAADESRWRTVIFPNLVTLLGAAVGVTDLHCACVVRDEAGILLAGGCGAGKSTLSLALARQGFGFLSDDCTFFSKYDGEIRAWGLIPRLKLLTDASVFFPELAGMQPAITENGEPAFEIDTENDLGIPRSRSCRPEQLVFLERTSRPDFVFTRMPAEEALLHLQENLLADTPEALEAQLELIGQLVERGCWQMQYGEAPDVVAQKLAEFVGQAGRA